MTKQDAIKILTDGEWWDYLGDACPDIYNLSDAIYYAIDAMHERDALKAEIERLKRERDAAVKELFRWTRCPVCKHWIPADEWCERHDRHADSFDGCDSAEWRGVKEGAEDG